MNRQPLAMMRLGTVRDIGTLDPTPPPLSFARDLNLPEPAAPDISYKSPRVDFSSFCPQGRSL